MTERICPSCLGEGVVEIDDEELEEDVDEDTGEPVTRLVPTVHHQPCPICAGSGIVDV
jgi:hypothetical protein